MLNDVTVCRMRKLDAVAGVLNYFLHTCPR